MMNPDSDSKRRWQKWHQLWIIRQLTSKLLTTEIWKQGCYYIGKVLIDGPSEIVYGEYIGIQIVDGMELL